MATRLTTIEAEAKSRGKFQHLVPGTWIGGIETVACCIAAQTDTMSRLASLSTPTRRHSPSPSPSPAPSDPGMVETTHHRMLKLVITEFKGLFRTWDDLVGVDGLKAGQGIINAQTTME